MTLLLVLERPSEERFLCSASKFFFSLIMRAAANAMILTLVTLFWGVARFSLPTMSGLLPPCQICAKSELHMGMLP